MQTSRVMAATDGGIDLQRSLIQGRTNAGTSCASNQIT